MIDEMESITAKLCSFARAYHSNHERSKIFDDYLAYDLMGKEEYEEIGQLIEHDYDSGCYDPAYTFKGSRIREKLNKYISPIPLSRAAFAEKELEKFAKEKDRCQYVICGAGMDTFGFRNADRRIKTFEIDHPDTQRYKIEKIKELEWNIPDNLFYVPVDFSVDDMTVKLKDAGFDPEIPSFFAILGVTYYLTLPVFEETLERIAMVTSPGSKVVFDFPDDTTFGKGVAERVQTLSEITDSLGEPMVHGYAVPEVYNALAAHGFKTDEHASPEKIQKIFFENRTDDQRAFENIHLIIAKKVRNRNVLRVNA